MRTDFPPALLQDPANRSSEAIIRKCVHCGFCTATCPTYVLLGDELDSPRGRIYLIKDMLENQRQPTAETVKHVDRCLSCLSCMTTCPSGVNYMHLIDHARSYIHQHYARPWHERLLRAVLAWVLPQPRRFRLALSLGRPARPLARLFARVPGLKPLAAMLSLVPSSLPRLVPLPAAGDRGKKRVILLQGCVEQVLKPEVRAATIRLLEQAGYAASFAAGEQCCGALVHHIGREADSLAAARRNVDCWTAEIEAGGVEAIIITASGCGTTVKDYGHMLRDDPDYAKKAARISTLAKDISEFLDKATLPAGNGRGLRVAYHPACSLSHGQKVVAPPKQLLERAGYEVGVPAEAHLCCGSAGTYNIFQPEISGSLRDRKLANIAQLQPDVIASGNIGCMMQLGHGRIPVAHTVELLDWATGGPRPSTLAHIDIAGE
ncbi:glycolate oxidase subunit GlcF [Sphingobium sp. TKS]|uniref:glycolate oxidase subunit GlcF n=1 Tax=Sphingobium sp. TKS TaxID=1315974 RepID=UPI00077024F8|nr:glycolate oxidase subunit GlcF [Sphingobium sp. TKS]AMK25577.1 hypothetical protein K426_23369 [Sphingobium sp. TKS]